MEATKQKYEMVIGLEVHAQLKTNTKTFSPDGMAFGKEPNSQISVKTVALPGALPVLNRKAVDLSILCGLAFGSTIAPKCKFDRKQYFYPDLPAGYQISQLDEPICIGGEIKISNKTIQLTRAHLEEDAGKLVHAGADGLRGSSYSLVDLNRAGSTLLEIVSEPDIRSAEEAREYLETLRSILRYIGACDGNLEEGSMRCDANVSIRPWGAEKYGTRVEIKNLNSFRALVRAIDFEYERQSDLCDTGECAKIVQETRLWDDNKGVTVSMRSKEDAQDYRYFPEPDLMPLEIDNEWIERIRATMPELPKQKLERYQGLGLSEYDANIIIAQMDIAQFFDKALELNVNPKIAANFLMGEISAYLKEIQGELADTKLTVENFAKLLALIEKGTITNNIAKCLVLDILKTGGDAEELVEKQGLSVMGNEDELLCAIRNILEDKKEEVEAYRNGKDKLFGFFVGQVMKETKGRANPKLLNELLKKELDA